jgi:DNA-binding MurR/RpiR family transcriptional regulator
MKNHTTEVNKKRLEEVVDSLTEENRRYFLGVVEALNFAQNIQNQVDTDQSNKKANSGVS